MNYEEFCNYLEITTNENLSKLSNNTLSETEDLNIIRFNLKKILDTMKELKDHESIKLLITENVLKLDFIFGIENKLNLLS